MDNDADNDANGHADNTLENQPHLFAEDDKREQGDCGRAGFTLEFKVNLTNNNA